MTDRKRLQIAREFRKMLDDGILRKVAISGIIDRYEVDRATLYRWCARFGVSTR